MKHCAHMGAIVIRTRQDRQDSLLGRRGRESHSEMHHHLLAEPPSDAAVAEDWGKDERGCCAPVGVGADLK